MDGQRERGKEEGYKHHCLFLYLPSECLHNKLMVNIASIVSMFEMLKQAVEKPTFP